MQKSAALTNKKAKHLVWNFMRKRGMGMYHLTAQTRPIRQRGTNMVRDMLFVRIHGRKVGMGWLDLQRYAREQGFMVE